MKPASIGCASVVAAPTFGRGDDRNSIGEVEFRERIWRGELRLEAVGARQKAKTIGIGLGHRR